MQVTYLTLPYLQGGQTITAARAEDSNAS